jgi:hypothetical protein
LNIAKLEKFKQTAGNDFIKLIEAQESGVIPKELSIRRFSDLLEKDGSPEIQASIKFLWNKGPWGLGFFGKHIGEFYETRNRLSYYMLLPSKAYHQIAYSSSHKIHQYAYRRNLSPRALYSKEI